jgi:hypothetical protein
MATGRIRQKDYRCYVGGYDMSGYSRTVGPLEVTFDEAELTAYMGDTVKGYLPNHANVNIGTLNTVFDNTAAIGMGLLQDAGLKRYVTIPIGIRAAPVDGDPCFGGAFIQKSYQTAESGGGLLLNLPFSGWAGDADTLLYAKPWGILLHANATRTEAVGVNISDGFDNPTGGATSKGGYFIYHVFAGDGTATLSVDDGTSAINADMDPLAGATSGVINCAVPRSGIVPLSPTAAVRQFVRWQIDFDAGGGTATTVTFACAFMRGY